MKLATKTMIVLTAIILGSTVANYLIVTHNVMPSFETLERREAEKDLQRYVDAIGNEVDHLSSFARDWASWDDMYAFVLEPSEEFEHSNLVWSTFSENKLNLLFIYDLSGKVVWGRAADLEAARYAELAEFPASGPPAVGKLIGHGTPDDQVRGIVVTERGPMLIASRPIVTSEGEGPLRGSLVVGRLLDAGVAGALAEQAHVAATVMPPPAAGGSGAMPPSGGVRVRAVGNDELELDETLADVTGAPAVLVKVVVPRSITAMGQEATYYVIAALLAVGLLIIAVMWLLSERMVIRPLARLTEHALRVGRTGNLSERLVLTGRDEIGALSREVDHMLAQLADARERTEAILNSTGEGIVGLDNEGRIVFVNPTAAALLHWHASEQVGRLALEVRHLVGDAGDSRSGEEVVWRSDGTNLPVEYVCTPLSEGGLVSGSVIVLRDVTRRRRLEEGLRQAQRLEAVGRLAGGIAHEFNNLLMAVGASMRLLKRRLPEAAELQDMVDIAIRASERGAELTDRMLSYGRRQLLAPRILDLNQVVSENVRLYRPTLGETVAIDLKPGNDLWSCELDQGQLESTLLNLALNARDAMPQGGRMTIATRNVELDQAFASRYSDLEAGAFVLLTVSDTGTGMSDEVVRHAFEPFFTTKDVGEGTGLGLSTVYGFVKQSGGHIELDSVVGKGTAVRLYFPATRTNLRPLRAAPEPPPAVAAGGGPVLTVEDDALVRDVMRQVFAELGFKPIEAVDAPSALTAFQAHPEIELVLADVVMPGAMDGIELARELKRRRPATRIILMSGYPEADIEGLGLSASGLRLLRKPFTPAELTRALRGEAGG